MKNNLCKKYLTQPLNSDCGATAVLIAISLIILLSFAALAIDMSHLYVVRNELQNAADSGALAGARDLYLNDSPTVNVGGANQTGYDTATLNMSEGVAVDVHGLQGGDVEIGHWSFAAKTFTPNDSVTTLPDLWDKSTAELDADPNFINAARVKTRREDTPAASFLAGIFGKNDFILSAEAVAYRGFAGTMDPGDADMPIAICKDSLLVDGHYSCSIGRMINSGSNVQTHETAGWTSYDQQRDEGDSDPCLGGTNANDVRNIINPPGPDNCFGENIEPILLGKNMATMGGEAETVMSSLRDCWEQSTDTDGDGKPDTSWNLTLPVIECAANNVGVCEKVVGAVNVNVLWVTGSGTSTCNWSENNLPPTNIDDWSCAHQPPTTIEQMNDCWNSFVSHFSLQNADGSTAPCAFKSLYFKPDCTVHEPTGRSGGENFGIMSKYPVLVN